MRKKPKAPINGNAPAKLASKPRPRSLPVLRPETPAQKALKTQQRRLTFNCDKKIAESDYDHTEVSTIDLSRERREGEEQSYESKSGYIMATALTAAAFSSYLVVKSFRALFL